MSSADLTRYALSLGARDATTGHCAKTFTEYTIEGSIQPRGATDVITHGCSYNIINDNQCSNNLSYGIQIASADCVYNILAGNQAQSNGTANYVDAASDNEWHNYFDGTTWVT